MDSEQLYTIENLCTSQIKEKGSKFIGYLYPFENETELDKILTELKKVHKTARHFCLAYRIGTNNPYERFKDDGEPSGTAGKPILSMLQKYGLSNALLVVVRYFGGTLLGTGGLAKAYKDSANEAILKATLVELHNIITAKLICGPEEINLCMKLLKENNAKILSQEFVTKYYIEAKFIEEDFTKMVEKLNSYYETTIELIKLTP